MALNFIEDKENIFENSREYSEGINPHLVNKYNRTTIVFNQYDQIIPLGDGGIFWLKMGEVPTDATNNRGCLFLREGSITGISINYQVLNNEGTGQLRLIFYINGVLKKTINLPSTVNDYQNYWTIFEEDGNQEILFKAGDTFALGITDSNNTKYVSFENGIALLEVNYG